MKSLTQLLLVLLLIAVAGFLVRKINVDKKKPVVEEEEKASTLHLSYRSEELSLGSSLIVEGERHFANMRQLTSGGENAEAYFGADGATLSFQAHEGEDACDQIYVLNIESGEIEKVSSGAGVTTCSFFQYPSDDAIIYSSTHLGGEECPPKPDPSLGYVWKLHPTYDIFKLNNDGSGLIRLTDTFGYDAEATYAFDGSKIVFTSLASGDLDLWTMDPDGSNRRQFTHRLGYDGGAFFSHDGRKIVWRAYYPETQDQEEEYLKLLKNNAIRPMALQIWLMHSDGTHHVQVTDNEASNFAPFFFPDDSRIIFASNLGDPQGHNFDLYAVDTAGTHLEQITFYEGFDGFPMFSPDGNRLVFASNRNAGQPGETNLFICDWVEQD